MITIIFLFGIIQGWWDPSLWWMVLTLLLDVAGSQ